MSAEVTPEQMAEWREVADLCHYGSSTEIDAADVIYALLDKVERLQLAGECTADDRDHYIERANKAEAERDAALRDVAILRPAAAHAEKAEAELRALREGVERLIAANDASFPRNKSAASYTGIGSNQLRALLSDGPSA